MRLLTTEEMGIVVGGTGVCTPDNPGGQPTNNYGGIQDTSSIGPDIINAYEGLVEATSYIIERVANAL